MSRLNLLRRQHEEYLELFDIPDKLKRKHTPKVEILDPQVNIADKLQQLKQNYNENLRKTITNTLAKKKQTDESKRRLIVLDKVPK